MTLGGRVVEPLRCVGEIITIRVVDKPFVIQCSRQVIGLIRGSDPNTCRIHELSRVGKMRSALKALRLSKAE